jgi:nucleotide-binding universal stress UspA family protein
MNKIIAAFDGLKYSESTRDYAVYFTKQANAHLVGVFLDDPTYTSQKIYELMVKQGVPPEKLKKFETKDKATRDAAAKNFAKVCQNEKLKYSVHRDRNVAIQDLKHESIYADLLIIDSAETLTYFSEKLPTRFMRDLLTDTQCPVMVVPQKYKPVQKIILLYDGEPSSVHAIKMFSYLLPKLKFLDPEVISVAHSSTKLRTADLKLMKEFMKRHYPKAKYNIIKGWAEDEIVKYLKQKQENSLVVLGAYRRGTVSRWFRESMADILMKEVKLPLFIAHNK